MVRREQWVERKFYGGPLHHTSKNEPVQREKVTHYVYGEDVVDGEVVNVVEYVYRLHKDHFHLTEVNGIIRDFSNC